MHSSNFWESFSKSGVRKAVGGLVMRESCLILTARVLNNAYSPE